LFLSDDMIKVTYDINMPEEDMMFSLEEVGFRDEAKVGEQVEHRRGGFATATPPTGERWEEFGVDGRPSFEGEQFVAPEKVVVRERVHVGQIEHLRVVHEAVVVVHLEEGN